MEAFILFIVVALLATSVIYSTFMWLQHREKEALRFAVPRSSGGLKAQFDRYFSRNRVVLFVGAAALLLFVFRLYLVALLLLLAAVLRKVYLRAKRRREILEHLPAAVAIMTRSLKAGQTIEKSLKSVVEYSASPAIKTLFQRIVQMVYISGRPVHEVIFEQARQEQNNELNMLASILESHAQVGGNVIEVLGIFEEQMRRTTVTEKKISALMSEGRTSIVILAIIPLVVFAAVLKMSPGYLDFYLRPEGRLGLFLVPLFYLIGVGFSVAFVRGK